MQNYVANVDANVLCGFMKIRIYTRDMTYEKKNITKDNNKIIIENKRKSTDRS